MRRISNNLSVQILLGIFFSSLLSCLVAGAMSTMVLLANLRQELRSQLETEADELVKIGFQNVSADEEQTQIPLRIQKALAALENPIVRIFDSSKNLVYATVYGDQSSEKSAFLDSNISSNSETIQTTNQENRKYFIVHRTYKLADGQPRVLQMAIPLPQLSKVLQQSTVNYAFILAVFLIVSFFLSKAFTQRLLQPVKQVASHLGSLSRIEPKGWTMMPQLGDSDFLGEIMSSVNHLIARVQESSFANYQLSHSIAHEIRSPLVTMLGEIERHRNFNGSQKELHEILEKFEQDIIRIEVIVKTLLELAQRDRVGATQSPRPAEITGLVRSTISEAEEVFNLTIHFAPSPKEKTWVLVDPDLLSIVLNNLFRNCSKHAGPSVIVQVALKVDNSNFVKICVEDNGPGLSPEMIVALRSKISSVSNVGIGLNLCKQVCSLTGWKLSFKNLEPQGLSATIEVPVSQKHQDVLEFLEAHKDVYADLASHPHSIPGNGPRLVS